MLPPDVSWSIANCWMLNPIALALSRISHSMSPSAPLDVPCQFAPGPRLVLCANQAILSEETS